MNKSRQLLVGLLGLLVVFAGCEREITGTLPTASNESDNCFECHNGLLDQAQGEWANSVHASGNNIDYTNRGGLDCTRCHNQEGYLFYLETGQVAAEPFANVSAIGCFACHNPHEDGDNSIRFEGAVTLPNGVLFDYMAGNQCATCHQSRFDVRNITDDFNVTSFRFGPHHGPQGEMVAGTGGWEFEGAGVFTYATTPHRVVVRDACAGCHMGDVATHIGYQIGGHSFRMRDEGLTEDMSQFCADPSCHPGVESFDFMANGDFDGNGLTEGYQTEFQGLVDSLEAILFARGLIEANGRRVTGVIADRHVAGSVYNWVFAWEDQSNGSHNWQYISRLLIASIDYLNANPAPPGGDFVQPLADDGTYY